MDFFSQGKYVQQREEIKSVSPKSGKAGKTKLLALSLFYLAERRNQLLQRQDPLPQPLPPHLPANPTKLTSFFYRMMMMMSSLIKHRNWVLIMAQIN